ncbi:MAG: hypothetical protein IID41_03740 [Planctomycetes bacterium]|nr:hypothetical protein [Planctomycetota bacterium]
MPDYRYQDHQSAKERQALGDIPLVPAIEFFESSETGAAVAQAASSLFADQREYRFCKAVMDHPLQPSSRYPKLVGVSSKTAVKMRRALVAKGFIREQIIDSGGRGRSTILLEPLGAGRAALTEHESGRDGGS